MRTGWAIVSVAACSMTTTTLAGPDWVEGGDGNTDFLPDAGPLPATAQPVGFGGPVNSILGSLGGAGAVTEVVPGDFEDMYLVTITNFQTFFIITNLALGQVGVPGLADTSLFLFTGPDHPLGPGLGILANNATSAPPPPGTETPPAALTGSVTDGGTTPLLIDGLTYYVAITGTGRVPVDAAGAPIFAFGPDAFEISSPDGPGGANPIAGWAGVGQTGVYLMPGMISVSSANTLIPGDLNGDGAVNGLDLAIVLNGFGNAGGPGDANHDGVVDGGDIAFVLNSWTG